MDSRLINALAILSLVGIFALFATHFIPMAYGGSPQKYLDYSDVSGIDVMQSNMPWTLNLKQQTEVIDRINQGLMIQKADFQPTQEKFPFDSIIIHRFKNKDIVMKPIGRKNKNIVFSAPQLNDNNYLQDVSEGALMTLLQKTYDQPK